MFIALLPGIRTINYTVNILFSISVTIIYLVNLLKLTPVYPDGVECTHLT